MNGLRSLFRAWSWRYWRRHPSRALLCWVPGLGWRRGRRRVLERRCSNPVATRPRRTSAADFCISNDDGVPLQCAREFAVCRRSEG